MSVIIAYAALLSFLILLALAFGACLCQVLRVPLLSSLTPIAGLAVLCATEWVLLELGQNVHATAWPMTALALVSSGVALRESRRRGDRLPLGRDLLLIGLTAGLTLAIFLYYYSDSLSGPLPRPSSLGNNDLPYYALLSQHLLEGNFSDAGRITTGDLGTTARSDVTGVFMLVATAARLTNLSVATVLMPVLAFGVFLVILALSDLLRQTTNLSTVACVLAACAGCDGSMFFYGVGQGFVSQYYGMAAFFTSLAIVAGVLRADVRPPSFLVVARLAVPQAVLLFFYPHMAILGTAVLAGVLVCVELTRPAQVRTVAQRLRTSLPMPLLGLGVALVVCTSRSVVAIQRTLLLRNSTGGWNLGQVSVTQALGLAQFPTSAQAAPIPTGPIPLTPRAVILAACALVVTTAILVRIRRSGLRHDQDVLVAWPVSILLCAGWSYAVFYAYYGYSYQQWKWALFFQPLIPTFAVAGLLWALKAVGEQATRAMPVALGSGVTAALVLTPLLAGGTTSRQHTTRVDDALVALSNRSDLSHNTDVVAISAGGPSPYWDTMWAAFYSPARRDALRSPSYFAPADSRADGLMALERADHALPFVVCCGHRANPQPVLEFGQGFYAQETDGVDTWHWSRASAGLLITNPTGAAITVQLHGLVQVANAGAQLVIRADGRTYRLRVPGGGETLNLPFTVPPGRLRLDLTTDSGSIPTSRSEQRALYIRLVDLVVQQTAAETAGTAAPDHP